MSGHENRVASHEAKTLQFLLVHCLYATALFAASLATFGGGGVIIAMLLGSGWGYVFTGNSRPRRLASFLVILLPCCCLLLLFPAVSTPREAGRRMQCANNLKQIAIGLHNYHDVNKTFPPAYIADAEGRPMHSWRALILPYVGERKLYDQYDFSEAWDGPNNRPLLDKMPQIYSCPSQPHNSKSPRTRTSYVGVVGEKTVWPGEESMGFRDITDGTSSTILICEFADLQIPWTKPTDLGLRDAVDRLTSTNMDRRAEHSYQSYFYESGIGRQVTLADGSVVFLGQGIRSDDAFRLLTRDDGMQIDIDNINDTAFELRRLHIGNWVRLGIFILVALWPLPWVWIHPHGTTGVVQKATNESENVT
ncbi:MAG: DUF1559 domain-containing protein [Planctomycetes bacterium]|nr:DUF1559 domain-containing protein [Planctomycetota bacterium]